MGEGGRPHPPTSRYAPPDEADVYASLVDGEFGPNVRLEQERVRYHLLEVALNDLCQEPR